MTAPDTTREGLAKAVEDVAVKVLREHVLIWQSDGDYGERVWVECSCEEWDDDIGTDAATWESAHRAHVAQALAAALHDHLTAALAAEREAGKAEHRIEWADYLSSWDGAIGPEPPTVQSIIARLRGPVPFGRAAGGSS